MFCLHHRSIKTRLKGRSSIIVRQIHTQQHTHIQQNFYKHSIHLQSHTSNRIQASKQTTDQASKPTNKHAEMSFQQPPEKTEMKSIALKLVLQSTMRANLLPKLV